MRRATVAFATALILSPALLCAQRADGDTPPAAANSAAQRKSPLVARIVGVLPGAGHMYAGEPGRGLAYLGGMFGILTLTATVLAADCLEPVLIGSSSDPCENSTAENVGAAAFFGLWVWSIHDAGRAARRTNAASRPVPSLVLGTTRVPTATGGDARALKVGVRFRVR